MISHREASRREDHLNNLRSPQDIYVRLAHTQNKILPATIIKIDSDLR